MLKFSHLIYNNGFKNQIQGLIMKRVLVILAWLSGAVGMTMMMMGLIILFTGDTLWSHTCANFIYPGTSFLILGIFFFMAASNARRNHTL